MNDEQKKRYIAWLRDAHAMELGLVQNLEEQARDAQKEGKMEIKARIDEHIEETKRHAEKIESCMARHGENPSTFKDTMGKAMGFMQGAMKSMFADPMVKNALESYAAEHMEIAAYRSLTTAAEALGDTETAEICRGIIEDEVRMAEWVFEQIPVATQEHVAKIIED